MISHKLTTDDRWFTNKGMVDSLSRAPFQIGDIVVVCENHHVSLVEYYENECFVCHSSITIPFSQSTVERGPVQIKKHIQGPYRTHQSMITSDYHRHEPTYGSIQNSNINTTTALILCVFLGSFGAHYFYCRKIGAGILFLLTGGFLGIGVIVDMFRLSYGNFSDSDNNSLPSSKGGKVVAWLILVTIVLFFGISILN